MNAKITLNTTLRKFLYLLMLLASTALVAQSRIELVHADFSRGVRLNTNEEVKILEGSVHIRQDTVEIFCDQAEYYREQNKVVLLNSVRLIRGSETLTANKVTYYELSKIAVCEGKVHLERPEQRLFCDYLRYFYETDQSFAKGNLVLIDDDARVTVTAEQGEYLPEQSLSRVERNAHFLQVDSSGTDTLHIFAEKMVYQFDPERMAIATDSVRIIRADLFARCDSAVYQLDMERVFLEIEPVANQKNNELTGYQIEFELPEMELSRIIVRQNAVAISVEDSASQKINRLSGKEIQAFIQQRQITELWAYDNARSQYFLKNEEVVQGVNNASADTIKVFFREGEVDIIQVKGGAEGVYKPDQITKKQ